jgi:exonuclease SbcD
MMRLPVRILSDLHLGHRASRIRNAEELRPLVSGAGTVVFNGDTWEELAGPWKQQSAEMLADLKRILKEEGCDTVFLLGNHDPGWDGPAHLSLAEGKILVTHGDALIRNASPWKHEILSGNSIIEEIWNEFPDAAQNLESRLEIARQIATRLPSRHLPTSSSLLSRIADAAWPPQRALAMLDAWLRQGSLGADFCETYAPDAEILVIGHFHRRAIHSNRGRTIINTGSFVVPGPASWVSWDGKMLSTGKIMESGAMSTLGPKSRTWEIF